MKKALLMGAFFVSSFLISTTATACQSGELSDPVAVKFVYDGDTLYLKDGRKVRIIGIDTPEARHHKQIAEAFSGEAAEALRELLYQYDNQVQLQIGEDAYDRYGRLLAHVFLPNGTNISKWMLSKGFATTLFIPPNLNHLDCYRKAERQAQNKQLNIWKQKRFHLQIADLLDKSYTGYTRLVGRVIRIKKNKRSLMIYLRGGIRIKISSSNLHYFKNIDPDLLKGKRISATGLLRKRGKLRTINVKHPVYFDVL